MATLSIEALKERVEAARNDYVRAKIALMEGKREAVAMRVCCKCKKQIRTHHKWQFITTKCGTQVQHRTCKYPDYYSAEQARRINKP